MDRSVSSSSIDWLRTWRGRRQALAVIVFAVLCAGVPLFYGELYPFSTAPMFEDAPQLYCDYKVLNPQGQEMKPADFGLQRNYWGNPVGVGTGFRPPPTVDQFGSEPHVDPLDKERPPQAVKDAVVRCLAHRDLPYVEVICEVIGPTDNRTVGVEKRYHWHIDNPEPAPTKEQP